MGQYECHVFVCTSGETCPTQGDTEKYVKVLRAGVEKAGKQVDVRSYKTGCFSQCGHGPMIVFYSDDVWYAGVQESDLDEILTSHILGGRPVERLRYAPGVPGANKIDVEKKDLSSRGVDAGPASPSSTWKRVCRVDEVAANGIKQFTVEAGLDYDVSISARNAASLRGHFLNTNPAGWDLLGNIASQKWGAVVLQD